MEHQRHPHVDRRHAPRASVSGNAIVHAITGVARCDIVNISIGGVLLRATESAGLHFGHPVIVELHLDATDTEWIHLRGHVQRIDDGGAFGVSFHHVSPQFEDIMGDEVLAALECDRRPHVLLIDLSPTRRGSVAAALRDAGCIVVEALTPLDAIAAVEQSRSHIEMALVGDEWTGSSKGALTAYLRHVHPEIELVTIADRPRGRRDRAGWVFANQRDLERQIRPLLDGIVRRRGRGHASMV
jgi:CheY-like chemotaxis protein